ncbi:MAG: hypothetical protein AAGJ08_02045 [Cyanobacteria bacterium P01_H01_bin.35]
MADGKVDDTYYLIDGEAQIKGNYQLKDSDNNYYENYSIPVFEPYYASVSGTNGPDTIFGATATGHMSPTENEYIKFQDFIEGKGGNDHLHGMSGEDDLFGNRGNDLLEGGSGNDYLDGGIDDDDLRGDENDDKLYGRAGNDHLYGGNGSDLLEGGDGNDVLLVTAHKGDENLLKGGAGEDLFVVNADSSRALYTPGSNISTFFYDKVLTDGTDLAVSLIKTFAGESLKKMFVTSLALEVFKETFPAIKKIFDTYVLGNGFGGSKETPSRISDSNSVVIADFDPTRDTVFIPIGNDGSVNTDPTPNNFTSSKFGLNLDGYQITDNNGSVLATIAGDGFSPDTFGAGSTVNQDVALQTWNNRLTIFNDGRMEIGTGGSYNSTQVPDSLNSVLDPNASTGSGFIFLGAYGSKELYGDNGQGGVDYLFGTQLYGDFLHGFAQDAGGKRSDDADDLFGYGGDDFLYGSYNDDRLYGGDGSDTAIYQDLDEGIKAFLTDNSAINGNSLNYVDSVTDDGSITYKDDLLTQLYAVNAFGQDEALGDALLGAVKKDKGTDSLYSIENIVGTNYADTIEGNSLDNTFTGLMGNDVLKGKGGSDTVDYSYTTAGVQVILNANDAAAVTVTKKAAERGETDSQEYTETIYGFENVIGSDHGDTIHGTGEVNILEGNDGDDYLWGRGGNDIVDGGKGNDTLDAGLGSDTMRGGDGDDSLQGHNGNKRLYGGSGNDTINAATGNDIINGGEGNDIINGGKGNDTINGGKGNDTFVFDTDVALGSDVINTTTEKELYSITLDFSSTTNTNNKIAIDLTETGSQKVNNNLTLSLGEGLIDEVQGTAGNDTITGNDERNLLVGNGGNDKLTGGWGNDTLTGGNGADTFYLSIGFSSRSKDIITDFDPATEKIVIDNIATGNGGTLDMDNTILAKSRFSTSESGNDLILSYNDIDFAVLENVSSSEFKILEHIEGVIDDEAMLQDAENMVAGMQGAFAGTDASSFGVGEAPGLGSSYTPGSFFSASSPSGSPSFVPSSMNIDFSNLDFSNIDFSHLDLSNTNV